MDVDVRTLTDLDMEAAWTLMAEAFNTPSSRREPFLAAAIAERFHGVFVGSRLVAMCRTHGFGQYFGGRRVPMGGLAAVAVAAEDRGKGYGSAVVTTAVAAMRERGEPISALMPATTRLYRGLGWELAGVIGEQKIATRSLMMLPPGGGELRRWGMDDLADVRALYDELAPARDGFLDRPDWWWRTRVEAHLDEWTLTLVDGDGGIDGYVLWSREERPQWGHRVVVHELLARRDDAAAALWRMIGASASQAPEVRYAAPPEDPLLLLLPEQDVEPAWHFRWMLRIVDVPGAFERRGWRPGLAATLDLEVHDRVAPWNDGRWRVHVEDGRATVEKGGTGQVRLSVNTLAALYAGYAPASRLAAGGHLAGASARDVQVLDALLAGPVPWLPDFF